MAYDDEMPDSITVGPSGPDGTWKEGDWIQPGAFQPPVRISKEQAQIFNQNVIELNRKAAAAEASRIGFQLERPCPKCGYRQKPAVIHYACEESACQASHGKSEHLDRKCRRCHYTWAENCVEVG